MLGFVGLALRGSVAEAGLDDMAGDNGRPSLKQNSCKHRFLIATRNLWSKKGIAGSIQIGCQGGLNIILPGVCIGRNSAVDAGSVVVARDTPAKCLAIGNPTRVLRQL